MVICIYQIWAQDRGPMFRPFDCPGLEEQDEKKPNSGPESSLS